MTAGGPSPPRRFALIGDPVDRSPSPALHGAAFRAVGLPHTYEAVRVGAGDLEREWPRLRATFAGMNVTTPLKQRVIPLLDEVLPEAAAIGSVNTVFTFPDGRVAGRSTDGPGFLTALRHGTGDRLPKRALVLGAGGAARAVAAELRDRGTSVVVAARRPETAELLAAELGVEAASLDALGEALARADLLVNATPASDAAVSPLPEEAVLPPGIVVFDLVYRPRRTALLARAADLGCVTIEGVAMLVEQGARSFETWTGLTAPREEMRRAALDHLDRLAGARGR